MLPHLAGSTSRKGDTHTGMIFNKCLGGLFAFACSVLNTWKWMFFFLRGAMTKEMKAHHRSDRVVAVSIPLYFDS